MVDILEVKISSQAFFEAWIKAVNLEKSSLLDSWFNSTAYTKLIKSEGNCIIRNVANQLGLNCYSKDYYSIDSVLYSEEDLVPGIKAGSHWFRQIKVAFEHENNFKGGLFQEVSHLLITNAELKVLVTYPNGNTEKEMSYLHHIINTSNHCADVSRKENFLVIFGSYVDFQWEAFIYKQEGWEKMLVNGYL